MATKPMTLPSVDRATQGAINACYGSFIAHDSRWTANLPQYSYKRLKHGKNRRIKLIYTYAQPRLKRGA